MYIYWILNYNLYVKHIQNGKFCNVYDFEICFRELGMFAQVEHRVAIIIITQWNNHADKTVNMTVDIVILMSGYNFNF